MTAKVEMVCAKVEIRVEGQKTEPKKRFYRAKARSGTYFKAEERCKQEDHEVLKTAKLVLDAQNGIFCYAQTREKNLSQKQFYALQLVEKNISVEKAEMVARRKGRALCPNLYLTSLGESAYRVLTAVQTT